VPVDNDLADTQSVRGALATFSAGAAALHLALASEHMGHHWTMGVSFYVAAAVQLLWSGLLLVRPTRRVLALGGLGQAGAVATYFVVHAAGWPFGPEAWQPEPHELAGIVCCALEGAAALGALALVQQRLRAPRVLLPVVGAVVVALTGGTVAYGDTTEPHHHDTGVVAAGAHVHGHAHGTVDTTPPTAAQRAAADRLLTASRTSMARYADVAVAKRAGYKVIHNAGDVLLHYGNPAYMNDGHTVDPSRMESLIYVHLPRGGDLLVGGMYMEPKGVHGPAIGGSLTPWHAHDDLCLDPVKGIATSQTAAGCPAGSAVGVTGEMMHVWNIEYPGGPFAELDPVALRTAVLQYYGISATG
jgi:hypothetical protein